MPPRYGVRAYPTLLLLGDKDEQVHRFSGFRKPAEFVAGLEDALRRHRLYKAGEAWDEPESRPDAIADAGTVETFPAPSEEVPSGIVFLGDSLFVAQGDALFRMDAATAEVKARHAIPASVIDLCTDGTRLYAVEYGWTAGRPIHVIDPGSGAAVREIVTEANKANHAMGAKGVAWRDGRLWVLEGMHGRIHAVDPATGAVEKTLQTEGRWLAGLAFDGAAFVAGTREELLWIDPADGKVLRRLPVHYPLRSVEARGGAVYLLEQPVFGHDRAHRRVRVWPKRTLIHRWSPPPR